MIFKGHFIQPYIRYLKLFLLKEIFKNNRNKNSNLKNNSWNELNSLTHLFHIPDILQDIHNYNSTKMLPFLQRQITLKISF